MTLVPDPEVVLTAYLQAGVQSLGAAVTDGTPDSTDAPWVRVTLLDAPARHPDHLVAALFQLDCYAGHDSGEDGHEDASLIARTIRSLLQTDTIARASHAGGAVVTGSTVNSYLYLPDTEFEPARDRYVITATVWLHG